MANLNFYLKSAKPNKMGMIPIIAQITHDYKKHRKQLSKIKPGYWNPRKQRVKPNRENEDYNGYKEINLLIDSYEAKVKTFFNESLIYDSEITEVEIKLLLQGKDLSKNHIMPFFDAFNEFIKTNKVTKKPRTIKGYTTVKNFLVDFEKETQTKISFKKIDLPFFDAIKKYAFETREASNNYLSKIAAVLKTFLSWCKDRKYYNGDIHKKFSAPENEKDIICLTIEELIKLMNFEFDLKKHCIARDIYCFGCFTGLRISDIMQLTDHHIKDGIINKNLQKTSETETIPLITQARDIINKYRGHITIFPRISEQKLNKYIKTCCELAEIDTPTRVTKFQGGKKKETTQPKFELITLHTARKTFVSNSLRLGIDPKTIKSITGHKKDASFNKYLKIESDFKKEQMDKAWGKIII